MIYYNLVKEALEEIWYNWKMDKKVYKNYEELSLWNFFKNVLFSIFVIILFLFFIPIDIILSPLEIATLIYFQFKNE